MSVAILGAIGATAQAAEDFQVRYNLAGSLGGEIFAPADLQGLTGGIALTRVDIRKVTGNDGEPLTQTLAGGTLPLPAPTPAALYPTYGAATGRIDARGSLLQWNLGLAWLSQARYGGGRLALAVNLPYATKKQGFAADAQTPALNWNPAVPTATQSAVQARFDTQFQSTVAALAAAEGGRVSGLGDLELHAGWRHADAQLRVLAGASLVLPTGKYDAASGPDIGFGNFYTLRPVAQLVYLPRPDIALAGRVTVGLNTRNRDNDLRSGNWASLEVAAGTMTRLGPVGVHVLQAQQFQDDSGNRWGTSRYRSTNAGLFFTTRIPVVDLVLTLQHMATLQSRNAKHGTYSQVRLTKTF
ncbi:transporter [Pseudorhodoferax sp. Leaf274]|uniref:transporter n=1 Tax=Pseudorhodoferax sp. Leaf274 TaxID=1736318 RepID=UPI001F41B760|nr:transporter [Pseudorhodoferax sp. Leaf274]